MTFRADASIDMATGHIMRCLTLADELKGQGAEITFITRAHPGNMGDVIIKRGYELCLLPAPADTYQVRKGDVAHASWLGVPWEQDAEETSLSIGASMPDWFVVDHYGIDARWHKALRDKVGKIMVIDDLADRLLDCDFVLDQTYGRKVEDYKPRLLSRCQMLLGSQYALLRPRFSELRPKAIEKRKVYIGINRIMVSMGGLDPENVTATVLEGLSGVDWTHMPAVDVVLRGKAPCLQRVVTMARKSRLKILVSTDVPDMAERMLTADLAIGAGGTTSWERCCLGLPALTIITADNQKMVGNVLDKVGAVRILGISQKISVENIKKNLERLLKNSIYLHNMSQVGFGVTDGLGVKRVVLEMMPPYTAVGKSLRLRPVTVADTDLMFDWQTNDKTRRYAHNPEKPGYEEHRAWVRGRIEMADAYTEIILHGDKPSGVIRLDPIGTDAYMVSIYIDPENYGLGIGKSTLSYVIQLLQGSELRAEIHEDNHASMALFASMGFIQVSNGEYVKYACEKKVRSN